MADGSILVYRHARIFNLVSASFVYTSPNKQSVDCRSALHPIDLHLYFDITTTEQPSLTPPT